MAFDVKLQIDAVKRGEVVHAHNKSDALKLARAVADDAQACYAYSGMWGWKVSLRKPALSTGALIRCYATGREEHC
jgi:hypothetical protein